MKFLVLRFSSIGDIVLTSPVIRCLHQQFPEAEIHYFTKDKFASLLSHNPYINKLWLLDKENENEIIRQLKQEQFDCILDLHNNLRTLKIKWKLRGAKKYSVNKNNVKKWLMVNLKLKLVCSHIVERYLATGKKLNVQNDGKGLDFFISPDTALDSKTLAFLEQPDVIAFAVGGTYATKRMPVGKIAEFIAAHNSPVVMLGDNNDNRRVNALEAQFGDKVLNLCGKLNLHQSALVLQKSNKVVSHDSGLMHIAAALKKPVIAIWGNTVPEFGMGPYFPKDQKQLMQGSNQVDLKCRPCSKLGYDQCPKKHFNCMMQQQVATF